MAVGQPYRESGPQGRVRVADSSRGRGAERPRLRSADRVSEANRRRRLLGRRSAVARSALRASAEGVLSGFRPFGPGRMATPYGESKGGLWPSLNARRRSAALAAGEERIYARAGRLSPSRPSLVTFFGVKKVTRRRSTTDKLRRSLSGKSKTAVGRPPTTSAARRAANQSLLISRIEIRSP